jgi:signal transduction histidine kinase
LEEVEREFAQMKNELILAATSGLRTPIHTLQDLLEVLRTRKVDDQRLKEEEELFARSAIDAEHLSKMVDNLLNMTQLESGDLKLVKEEVDLSELIHEILRSIGHIAEHKGVALKHVLPRQPLIAIANWVQIRQVLTNLIDNAIKFSKPGGTVVVIGEIVVDGAVSISVSDQGVGIPKDELHRVFDKIYGVDGNVIKNAGGSSGLGLYISKKVIEAHGGSINVESKPGEGSTFYFSIPMR